MKNLPIKLISPRVEEKLKERKLNIKEIKQMLLNNEILGLSIKEMKFINLQRITILM